MKIVEMLDSDKNRSLSEIDAFIKSNISCAIHSMDLFQKYILDKRKKGNAYNDYFWQGMEIL